MSAALLYQYLVNMVRLYRTQMRWLILRDMKRSIRRIQRSLASNRRRTSLIVMALKCLMVKQRRFLTLKGSQGWWNNMLDAHSDEMWIKNFRMRKATFFAIVNLVKEELRQDGRSVRNQIPVEKQVGIAIYHLASAGKAAVTATVFEVSQPTVRSYFKRFCLAIGKHMHSFIYMPNAAEAKELARQNQLNTRFPQAYGVIDCTHIPICPPKKNRTKYYNSKGFTSFVLQALVDCNYRFRNINVRMPGSCHNAEVLAQSEIFCHADHLPKEPICINGVQVPLMMLGGVAYPAREWLMKPYTGPHLTPKEESFNCYHRSSCVVIENAFDRLKARWQILRSKVPAQVNFVPHVAAACCILHNIVEEHQTPIPPRQDNEEPPETASDVPELSLPECSYLNTDQSVVKDCMRDYLWVSCPHRCRDL